MSTERTQQHLPEIRKSVLTLQLLTPCFCSGADQESAEIRSPSIRGQLRWWYRALGGTPEKEKEIFGGIHGEVQASSLVVRVGDLPPKGGCKNLKKMGLKTEKGPQGYLLWPLGSKSRGLFEPREDHFPSFSLHLMHRPLRGGRTLPSQTLLAFALFGTLGTRSRRGYGSLWPESIEINGEKIAIPRNRQDVVQYAKQLLKGEDFRILSLGEPQESWSKALDACADFLHRFRCGKYDKDYAPYGASPWGDSDHGAPFSEGKGGSVTIYRPALGLPLTQSYSGNKGAYETRSSQYSRWASPLLLKIIALEEGYLPLGIFCKKRVLSRGELLQICEKGGKGERKNAALSLELWETMMDPSNEKHKKIWNTSEVLL